MGERNTIYYFLLLNDNILLNEHIIKIIGQLCWVFKPWQKKQCYEMSAKGVGIGAISCLGWIKKRIFNMLGPLKWFNFL